MTMRLDTPARNAACDGVVDLVDGGTGDNAQLELYSGSPPASVGGTPAGTLLAVVDYADPAFGDASSGTATALDVPHTTTGVDDGEVGFARMVRKDGDPVWDNADVGTSGNQIVLNTTTVSVGVDLSVESHTVTMPAGG